MAEHETDINNIIFHKALKTLSLRIEGSEISEKTGADKGNISGYINNKRSVPDNFLTTFLKVYGLNKEDFTTKTSDAKKERSVIETALEALIDKKLNDRLKYIEEMLALINKGIGVTALNLEEFRNESEEKLKSIDKKLNDVS